MKTVLATCKADGFNKITVYKPIDCSCGSGVYAADRDVKVYRDDRGTWVDFTTEWGRVFRRQPVSSWRWGGYYR